MTPAGYTEDALIDQPAIALFAELGWETVNAYHEFDHGASTLGRETRAEVVPTARLRPVLERFNPDTSSEVIGQAIEELTRDRSRLSPVAANREIYQLLKNGVRIPVPDPGGDGETVEVVWGLATLKAGKLVLDWRKRQQARAEVRVTIEKLLDKGLPRAYTPKLFEQKSMAVFHHVYDAYYGTGRSVYTSA